MIGQFILQHAYRSANSCKASGYKSQDIFESTGYIFDGSLATRYEDYRGGAVIAQEQSAATMYRRVLIFRLWARDSRYKLLKVVV
ncbi:hypothetical protein ABKN59_009636 [Abortiporus biennis]